MHFVFRLVKLIFILEFGMTQASFAATATTSLPVSATVLSVCIGLTATPLAFGAYDPTSSSSNTNMNTITVQCTLNNSYSIALNKGISSAGTVAMRKMTNGSNTLNYTVYTASNYAVIWGDGTSGTSAVAGTGTGLPQNYDVFGLIPSRQTSIAGVYADIITVTVTY